MADIVEMVGRALDQTGRLVANVQPDQLDLPTPCEDWNVRTLIGHLIRGNENSAAVAEGKPRQPNPVAETGESPAATYNATAEQMKQAWRRPGLLAGSYHSPLGMFSGTQLLTLRLADNVTHGWDLARATGQTPAYDDDIVQTALGFVTTALPANRPPGGPFAPRVEVPDTLPAIDRLAAATGRQP